MSAIVEMLERVGSYAVSSLQLDWTAHGAWHATLTTTAYEYGDQTYSGTGATPEAAVEDAVQAYVRYFTTAAPRPWYFEVLALMKRRPLLQVIEGDKP